MFTIKISETSGEVRGFCETVFEASQVIKTGDEIVVHHAEGGTSTWSPNGDGIVKYMYVVNRSGNTVATYRL